MATVLAAAACTDSSDRSATTTPTIPTTVRQFTPDELVVELDPDGRPYDEPSHGDTIEHVDLGTFHFPDGAVRVLDGNSLEVAPVDDETQRVEFGTHEDLRVTLIQRVHPERPSPVGVRLDVPDASVARWEPFEFAYGTDGGVGAITTDEVIRLAATRSRGDGDDWDGFIAESDIDYGATVQTFDLDGRPGVDSVIFSNGFGDGGFPMSRGVDSDGQIDSLVIWSVVYPWRLAILDGTPPADVTEREAELADCLAGRRPVEVWPDDRFYCTSDVGT